MKRFATSFVLVLALFVASSNVLAQSTANYTFSFSNTGSLVDMSSGTTALLATGTYYDDVASAVTDIGFTFTFMGVNYTQFSINSNGQLRLGSTVISGAAAAPALGVPLVAPMGGDNAILAAGRVHYRVDGSAPTRTLVVQWDSLRIPWASTPAGSVVQAILSESGGVIQFRYGFVFNNTPGTIRSIFFSSSNLINTVGSVTVGVTPTYSTAAIPTSNTFTAVGAVPNLSSTADGSRWVYTFTPPVGTPAAPINLTFTSVGRVAMTVNWDDNSTNEVFFTVSRATAPGGPFTLIATVPSTTGGGTGTTYSSLQTGLSPSTTYYFRIAAAHEGAASSDLTGSQATLTVTPFSGAFTINPDAPNTGTNFTTWGEAVSLLNLLGVTGPTTFTVTGTASTITFVEGNLTLGGLYVGGVSPSLLHTTLSATNTLTFVNGAGKTINMSGAGTGATGGDFVFRLQGVDWVTFDGINIVDTATADLRRFEFGYIINNASTADGANNNTIKNFSITLNKANTVLANGPYGVVVANGTTILGTTIGTAGTYNSRNNNNKIQNFTIQNLKRGIQFDGLPIPAFDEGNEVSGPPFTSATGGAWVGGSRITNFGGATSGTDYGIGIDGQKNMKVFNVQVDSGLATTAGTAQSGIHFGTAATASDGADNVEIYNCVIRNLQHNVSTTSANVGIRASGPTLHTVKIYNTVIYDIRATAATGANVMGGMHLNVTGAGSKFELYNNSINITGATAAAGTAKGLRLDGAAGTVVVAKNNAIQVTGGGSTGGAILLDFGTLSPTLLDFSNNVYNVGVTSPLVRRMAVYGGANRQNLIDWQSTLTTPSEGVDQGSAYGEPGFVSATDLTYGASNRVNNSGVPITGLSTNADILGETRSSTTPDVGVFEGTFVAGFVDAAAPRVAIAPFEGSIGAEIPVVVTDNVNASTNAIATLWYRLGTSGAFRSLRPDITPPGATNGIYRWSTSLRALAAGTYQYYIVVRDSAGNYYADPTKTPGSVDPGFVTYGTDSVGWGGANPFTGAGVRTFVNAGVTLAGGTYTVGTGDNYATLTDAVADINAKPLAGNVVFELTSNYSGAGETFPIVINQPAYVGTGPFTIIIRPAAGVTTERVTQGDPGTTNAVLVLDQARYVTLDGRPGGVGTSRLWRITNSRDAATIGEAIRLLNDASNNTIRYIIAESNNPSPFGGAAGVIAIRGTFAGGRGNNNNVIDNCDIRNYAAGTAVPPNPSQGLVSNATGSFAPNQNNVFTNNLIHNFHSITTNPVAIRLDNEVGTTITGNHIFQDTARAGATALTQLIGIGAATGPGYTITGNFLGGSAPNTGGAPYTLTSASGIYAIDVNLTQNTTPTTIANNVIANFNLTSSSGTAGSVLFTGVFGRGGNVVPINITNNTIGNSAVDATTTPSITFTSTGGVRLVSTGMFLVAGLNNIRNNTIGGYKLLATGAGSTGFMGIQQQTAGVAALIDGNVIGSTTTANNIHQNTNAEVNGIASLVGGATITNNTIANVLFDLPLGGTAQTFLGISGTAGVQTITGNTIRDVVSNSLSLGTTGIAAATGINLTSTSAGHVIENNRISNFTVTPATLSTAVRVQGIYISAGTSTGRVLRNHIHSLVNNATSTTAALYGIRNFFGTNWTYANNMISLGSGSAGDIIVEGISDFSDPPATGAANYFYNSVFVSGGAPSDTVNDTYAFRRITTTAGPFTLRNNIFVNNRIWGGGVTRGFAIGNTGTAGLTGWAPSASDYNVFKTSNDTIGRWLGTTAAASRTLAGWQAAQPGGSGGDANTIEGDPGFLSTTDLHISPGSNVPSNNATPVAAVTTDFDGDARSVTTPDRGADEYVALPPGAFALLSPVNDTTNVPINSFLRWGAALYAQFYDVYLDTSTAPTTLVSANQIDTTYGFALEPNVRYRWRVVAKNVNGNTNPNVFPFTFTTAAAPPAAPVGLVISNLTADSLRLAWTDSATNEEGFIILRALAAGGPFIVRDTLPPLTGTGLTGTYRDSPLSPNVHYYYRIIAFNRTQGNSSPLSGDTTTLARTPGAPTFPSRSATSITVAVTPVDNPASTQFAIRVATGPPLQRPLAGPKQYPEFVEGITDTFVQANGTRDTIPVWQTYAQWGGSSGIAVVNLATRTNYTFDVKARNANDIETAFGPSASEITRGIPLIALSPTTFNFRRQAGPDTTRASLAVRNTGTDTLMYTITPVNVSPLLAQTTSKRKPGKIYEGYELPKGAVDPSRGISPNENPDGRGGPDAFGYRWIDSDEPGGPRFSWTDIRLLGATRLVLGDDVNVGPFPLGFTFSFYGNTYSSLRVCSNGFLSFTSTSIAWTNTAIPTTAEPNNALYPFWDDLNPEAEGRRDTIYYYADAANQRFIVQYQNVRRFNEPTSEMTFQAIVNADGTIDYQYLRMAGATNSATIGIENAAGTIALQVVFNAAYVHDSLAIRFYLHPVSWLSTSRTSGTLVPGATDSVQVRVHPSFELPGDYVARLRVTGNAPNSDSATVNLTVIPPPLVGPYTIGPTDSFPTLSAAVAALQLRGVSGPVTFLFTQPSYTDTGQTIGGYGGQSTANSVTFRPASGVTARILFTGGSTENTFGVRMDSAVGVIWDGSNAGGTDRSLTLECDTIAPNRNGILVQRGSNFLTFKNLIVKGNRRAATTSFDVFRMDNLGFGSSGAQHHITVDNCHLLRGLGGIFQRGVSGALLDYDLTFTNNLIGGGTGAPTLDNLAGTGIVLQQASTNVLIDRNDINGIKAARNVIGIAIRGANSNVTVTNNKIHNLVTLSGAFRPIALLVGNIVSAGPAVKTRAYVANNMFYDIHNFGTGDAGRSVDGIFYNPTGPPNSPNGNGSTVEFYNNTWHIDYAAGEGTGNTNFIFDGNFAGSNTTPGHVDSIKFFNNVASSRRADSLASRMWLVFREEVPGNLVVQSDYNNYYFNAGLFSWRPNPWPGGTAAVFDTTLAQWQVGTGLDVNSIFGDPRFISATDAHIRADIATPVESRAIPIPGLTTDIDGDVRNSTTPDIGADEGVFVPYVLGTISATFDSVTARVNLAWAAPTSAILLSQPEISAASSGQPRILRGQVASEQMVRGLKADAEQSDVLGVDTGTLLLEKFSLRTKKHFAAYKQNPAEDMMTDEAALAIASGNENISRVEQRGIAPTVQVVVSEPSEEYVSSGLGAMEIASPATMIELPRMHGSMEGLPTDAPLTLVRFRIFRSVAGGPFALLDSVSATDTSYVDARVQARLYSYYLVAVFDDGTSQPSATASVIVPFIRAEVEPNNTAATANYMTLGYALSSAISPGGDVDYYRFTSATGHLIVDATNTPANQQTDVVVTLYDSTGTTVLYEVDRNYNDRLEFNLPYSGLYFVKIAGFGASETGPYTLFARIGPGTDAYEPDDGPLSRSFGGPNFDLISTLIDIATPYSNDTLATLDPGVGRGMGFAFDVDYYRFTAVAGDSVRITAKTGTVGSTILHARTGLGRIDQPTSFRPAYFSGHTNLVNAETIDGSDMVMNYTFPDNQTYLIYVMNHPLTGDAQTGPGARYLLQVLRNPVGVEDQPQLPSVYALEQNYPNPFNPTTQIKYALPKESFVTLKVYNVLGQELITLVSEEQKAGYMTVMWDGRNSIGNAVSSGMYFYRIEAKPTGGGDAFVQVKKMLMLK